MGIDHLKKCSRRCEHCGAFIRRDIFNSHLNHHKRMHTDDLSFAKQTMDRELGNFLNSRPA